MRIQTQQNDVKFVSTNQKGRAVSLGLLRDLDSKPNRDEITERVLKENDKQ